MIALLLVAGTTAFAQPNRDKQDISDRIEAMRISFITQRLDLTPEEAQKFWPVYNEYRKELDKHIGPDEDGPPHMRRPDINNMSDEEIIAMMEKEMERQAKLLELRRNYFKKFQKVLPVKKVAKLFEAERDFQRQLIRKLSDKDRGKR